MKTAAPGKNATVANANRGYRNYANLASCLHINSLLIFHREIVMFLRRIKELK